MTGRQCCAGRLETSPCVWGPDPQEAPACSPFTVSARPVGWPRAGSPRPHCRRRSVTTASRPTWACGQRWGGAGGPPAPDAGPRGLWDPPLVSLWSGFPAVIRSSGNHVCNLLGFLEKLKKKPTQSSGQHRAGSPQPRAHSQVLEAWSPHKGPGWHPPPTQWVWLTGEQTGGPGVRGVPGIRSS